MRKIIFTLLMLSTMVFAQGTLFIEVDFRGSEHTINKMWKIDKSFKNNASFEDEQNYLQVTFYAEDNSVLEHFKLSDPRQLRAALFEDGSEVEKDLHEQERVEEGSYIIRVPYSSNFNRVTVEEVEQSDAQASPFFNGAKSFSPRKPDLNAEITIM